MLHNCFTGPERSASVIADTKDHDISANFGVLARVETVSYTHLTLPTNSRV